MNTIQNYDRLAKEVLFHKDFLCVYLKSFVPNLKDYSFEEIKNAFGNPKINQDIVLTVENDYNERFSNLRYDKILLLTFEKEVFFLDIEIQKDCSHPKQLDKRKMYYQAAQLVLQKDKTFVHDEYQNITTVRSLRICLEPAKNEQNSCYYFKMKEHVCFGTPNIHEQNLVFSEIITVNLGDKPYKENPGMYLLHTLLKMSDSKEKLDIIQNEIGIPIEENLRKEMKNMFSFGQMIADSNLKTGIDIGVSKGIDIGVTKGIDIGVTKGIDIGEENTKRKTILNMLKANFPIETICQIADTSVEFVKKVMSEAISSQ
ncbi:MAG: hypothetical protein KBT48_03745 [Firmicutes bacterium]|nr:hypothetical protein [Bacillota bacterium]